MDPRELGNTLVDNATYVDQEKYHAIFTELRRNAPFVLAEPEGYRPFRVVSKYEDIKKVESQPAIFLNQPRTFLATIDEEKNLALAQAAGLTAMGRSLVNIDGDDHRSLRAVAHQYFAPANVKRMEDKVRELAREIVGEMLARGGECDFVNDVALWYPLRVILLILGLSRDDEAFLMKLTQQTFAPSDPDSDSAGGMEGMIEASKAIKAFFDQVMVDRRENPREDVASIIANARVLGRPIPDIDVAAYYLTIITAGHDTTSSTTAGGMHALLQHPDEMAKLLAGEVPFASAVNEFLRWTTPLKHFFRTAGEDTEIFGVQLERGDSLMMCYPSANRDEDVFDDPFAFRIDRNPVSQLAFGFGPHVCLGQHLAKLEMRVFYEELFARATDFELAGEAALTEANFVQGLKRLPIRFRPK